MQIDNHSVFEPLEALLPPPPPAPRAAGFAGFGKRFALSPWLSSLRSFSQVIFINHPFSGALLLLAFLLVSLWMALLAGVGMATANLTSRLLGLASTWRDQGIHGFNGVLVGCAAASLLHSSALSSFGLVVSLVALGGSLTTLMLELWSGCFHRRGDPPVLTLPFCLATWCSWLWSSPVRWQRLLARLERWWGWSQLLLSLKAPIKRPWLRGSGATTTFWWRSASAGFSMLPE